KLNKPGSKVVVVTNLTRNVAQERLQMIFGFYGEFVRLNLLLFGKCASELPPFPCKHCFGTHAIILAAQKAFSHTNGSQLDGATLKVELSDLPI
ncbi:hypothetical protein BJ322DRAFT_991106, partial [Thelephora terrestris]